MRSFLLGRHLLFGIIISSTHHGMSCISWLRISWQRMVMKPRPRKILLSNRMSCAVPSPAALCVDGGCVAGLVTLTQFSSSLGVGRMGNRAEGIAIVLGPEDGESYWQPQPSRGYVINKINPYTSPYDDFSVGIQVLEPGAHIRRHAHERSHELLFCFRGTGAAEIAGKTFDVREETILLIGRGLQHKVT